MMVSHISFRVAVRKPRAVAVPRTTALVLYREPTNDAASSMATISQEGSPRPAPQPATAAFQESTPRAAPQPTCAAEIKLMLRAAEPYEIADGLDRSVEEFVDTDLVPRPHAESARTVRINLADGTAIRGADVQLLARQSSMLRMLFKSGGCFRAAASSAAGDSWTVSLQQFDPAAVRGAVEWMLAEPGASSCLASSPTCSSASRSTWRSWICPFF